ncbi:hypothetical protein HUS23_08360 [Ectothiorhodospiraceae bacterium 2226]|nr:hypothetical protein HUS23_08360 [Ectothiorhodospiraceae bacterium 2226]
MTEHAWALLLAVAAPWVALLLLAGRRTRGYLPRWGALAAVPALGVALWLPDGAFTLGHPLYAARFGIDPLGRAFLLLAALVWAAAALFARGWLPPGARPARFMGFFVLCMGANFGLALAQDLLTFYVFFALMSFAAYGLIVHDGRRASRQAGRMYVLMMVLGEACLFTAVALVALRGPALAFSGLDVAAAGPVALLLFVLGFGIKFGLFGAHRWLALAHPAAPVPASAVLSGTMIKAGLLGWLRVADAAPALETVGWVLVAVGFAGAFYAALVGALREDPKALLAYSSISQMGLITALSGVALAVPEARAVALAAAALFALHHALAKGALFLSVGHAVAVAGGGRMLLGLGVLFLALALAGAPGTGGALVKVAATEVLDRAPHPQLLGGAFSLASAATALLMTRFLIVLRAYRAPNPAREARALWWGWGVLVVAAAAVPWWWAPEAQWRAQAWRPAELWGAAWPVLLGAAGAPLAARMARMARGGWRPLRAIAALARAASRGLATRFASAARRVLRVEPLLHEWRLVGKLLAAIGATLLVLLWWGANGYHGT